MFRKMKNDHLYYRWEGSAHAWIRRPLHKQKYDRLKDIQVLSLYNASRITSFSATETPVFCRPARIYFERGFLTIEPQWIGKDVNVTSTCVFRVLCLSPNCKIRCLGRPLYLLYIQRSLRRIANNLPIFNLPSSRSSWRFARLLRITWKFHSDDHYLLWR